LPFGIVAS